MNVKITMLGGRAAAAILALVVLPLGWAGCSRAGESNEGNKKGPDTELVERRNLEIRAEASGLIEPIRLVEVKSKVSGEVQSIAVETGDEIQQGALIAQIDPRDVRNAYEQAAADQELARARVATTTAQRKRAEQLAKAGVLSAQDLETTQLEETNAKAQLLKAQTNLELASEKTADVTIRSPIAGTVIEKTVEQGQIIASASGNVSGGTTLVKMADLAIVQARALVDEVDIGRIEPGQPAVVTVEAYPGRTFRGVVAKIEPQAVVDQNVTMFPVLVRLENPERLLKPGMNSEVAIEIADRQKVVAVPNGAVVNPREAANTGTALGLDEEELRAQMAAMRGSRGSRGGPGDSRGGSPGGGGPAAAGQGGPRGDSGSGGRGRWGGGGEGGGQRGGGGDASSAMAGTRPGVVFIKGANGPEPKFVQLGLSDWDYTEVVRGLEPGAEVYLITVARLQQQQEQFTNRMRERAGGGMFGGGGQGGQGGQRGGGGQGGGPR